MENLGIMAALGAAICWGTFMVPFKKSNSLNLVQFQAVMAISIGLSGLLAAFVLGYPINFNWLGLLSGALWGSASSLLLIAVFNLGITKAIPLISALVIIFSFLWGAVIFHELSSLSLGLIGVGLIVLGVVLVSLVGQAKSQNTKKGLLAGFLGGLIFGSQLVPIKWANIAANEAFFPMCFGILMSGLLIAVIRKIHWENKVVGASLLSGLIWNIGNLLSLISLSIIGLAKMGPISQSATLIAILWGLFYFKEVAKLAEKLQVLLGAMILITGIIVLGFA